MPLKIIRQDITKMRCDAIVCPTDKGYSHSGGTDAAIHAAAGDSLYSACIEKGPLSLGSAVITPAFNLPCKHVIHTVGPRFKDGKSGEENALRSCYAETLRLATENGCETVAIPLISSGEYGFPKDRVLKIAVDEITAFLTDSEIFVYLIVYDKASFSISEKLFYDVTSYISDNYTEGSGSFCELMSRINSEQLLRYRAPRKCIDVPDDGKRDNVRTDRQDQSGRNDGQSRNAIIPDSQSRTESRCEPPSKIRSALSKRRILSDAPSPYASEAYPETPYRLAAESSTPSKEASLEDMLKKLDRGFAETLFYYIDKNGMTDVECYKKANVDKKTFSKIKCNKDYRPSKTTAAAFAVALHLDLKETAHLLNTAGLSLSRSSKFDVIIEYFITTGNYKTVFDVNETLYQFDQPTLGVSRGLEP